MDFQKVETLFSEQEEMNMQDVTDIILDSYDGNSLKQFLEDMHSICKGNNEDKHKAVAAFGYYYIASKFDTLLIPMVQNAWKDMVKMYDV